MNTALTKQKFFELCTEERKLKEWEYGDNQFTRKGSLAKEALDPFKVQSSNGKSYFPKKNMKSYKPYKRTREMVSLQYSLREKVFNSLLPHDLPTRSVWKVKALFNIFNTYERQILPTIHLLFEDHTVTFKLLIEIYDTFLSTKLKKKEFPSFLLSVYDVLNSYKLLKDMKAEFIDISANAHKVNPKGQRYFGSDIWSFLKTKTGRDWRYAFDPCPRGNVFKDALKFDWPAGPVFLNPPFSRYLRFFEHAMKQYEEGKVTEILFVMPFNKWEGIHNRDPQDYIDEFAARQDVYDFNKRYKFFLENGERFDERYRVTFVHLVKKKT